MDAVPTRDHIVVGVDGSPASVAALRWAARAALLHRRRLHIVTGVGWPHGGLIGDFRDALAR